MEAVSTAADSPEADSAEEADMPGDVLGLILSVVIVCFFLGTAILITKYGRKSLGAMCPEVARKVVHIGVSNWFFIYAHVFESDIWPIVGLAGFTVINYILNVSGGLHVVMGQDNRKRNWGLVQYPIAIIILILLKHFGVGDVVCVGCAVLGMGYGDGLASLVGMNVKSPRLPGKSRKTVAGSVTMVLVTFVIFVVLNLVYRQGIATSKVILIGLLTAVCATLVEAYTPFGLDNLSVPLTIFLLSWLVLA